MVVISENANSMPNICAAADLSPWLLQLNARLDGALADLAHTMQSVQSGTYAKNANGQNFGLVQANFGPDATHLATHAIERAAETCFRSVIANFISFLDKLIAFQDLANEKVVGRSQACAFRWTIRSLKACSPGILCAEALR
jgi:hypothetical protein